jgi:hypothetical protein
VRLVYEITFEAVGVSETCCTMILVGLVSILLFALHSLNKIACAYLNGNINVVQKVEVTPLSGNVSNSMCEWLPGLD